MTNKEIIDEFTKVINHGKYLESDYVEYPLELRFLISAVNNLQEIDKLKSLLTEEEMKTYQLEEDVALLNSALDKHGKWINIELITPWVAKGTCTHCKQIAYINPDFPHNDWCPNCGANMSFLNLDNI